MALATALNVQPEKLNELIENKQEAELDSDAVTKLLNDALRVKLEGITKTHDLKVKQAKDEGHKAAERKVKSDLEKKLLETFDVSVADDAGLEDITEAITAKYANPKNRKAADLVDEDVKKHPLFVALEKKYAADLKKAKDEGDAAVQTLQKEYQRKEAFSGIQPEALEYFDAKKPVLSSDPAKAARQRQLVIDALKGYDFETVDGVTIISKDGAVVEDDLKNKLTLKALVDQIAEPLFDFKVAEDRQAPNADKAGEQQGGGVSGTGAGKYLGTLPKTKQELYKMANDYNIPLEQRQDLMAWGEKQTALPE